MGFVFNLSLRNLLRQKRRNILLGIGISFGMMILVIASSFSHGMVDVLIKDIVTNAFGHLVVQGTQGSGFTTVISDKPRIEKIIRDNIRKEDLANLGESLGMFGRAVGNGEADNVMVVGVSAKTAQDKKDFFEGFFTLVDGNFDEYESQDIAYPVIISSEKARTLNVKVHDVIRVRLPMVTGQIQAAQLTVIAIADANNTFMNLVLFMDGDRVKKLLGYKPWESANLQMELKDPKRTAKSYADILHQKLQPDLLSMVGKVNRVDGELFAFKNDDRSKEILGQNIRLRNGDPKKAFAKDGVMVSQTLAQKLNLQVGSELTFEYPTKYQGLHQEQFKIDAIYESETLLGGNILLLNGERIYEIYNKYLPQNRDLTLIGKNNPLYPVMATEWKLLERSKNSEELQKKYKEGRKVKTKQPKFDVITMYEGASQILQLEAVLNLITVIAVLVLFFIILIGVINTLRMTIKERTREIGTVRAIGMQKNDVRNMFITETLLLSALSCVGGIVLGIIVTKLLGMITFDTSSALSMILKDKHLFFKLNPGGILSNFILIMAISGITAFFPARRAAKLSAVEALRHYE